MDENFSVFNDRGLAIALVAILVEKLGNDVTVTQEDLDAIAYKRLLEEGNEDGDTVTFKVVIRNEQ